MGKFKMVCLDIDGTLLNSNYELTKATKEVIQIVANKKKIPVVLVSARMPKGILFLQEELGILQPIICYSGALIWDEDNIISSITMSSTDVKQVYNCVKELGIHMSLYKDNDWFIEELDNWAKQESEITRITPHIINFNDLLEKWQQENTGPNKILCMADPEAIELLYMKLTDFDSNRLNVYLSKTTYLEMMPVNVTKSSAIEFLCGKFGIQKSEIIAIGDNYNDINMIEYAGLGIAMGNAPDDVKQHAKGVTLTNDEDGVAEALKKHILVTESLLY